MISIVVPVWRKEVYADCRGWIDYQVKEYGAQLIEVGGYDSIFEALEAGRKQAKFDVILYVHDDVKLISPMDLAPQAVKAFDDMPDLGLIAPVGRGDSPVNVPWWDNTGEKKGHFVESRTGQPVYVYYKDGTAHRVNLPDNPNGWNKWAKVALADGFFLMENRQRVDIEWDCETFNGAWHGYDADRCLQTRDLGFDIMVSPWLFFHDEGGHDQFEGGHAKWWSQLNSVNELLKRKHLCLQ